MDKKKRIKIWLDDKFRIEQDTYSWNLVERLNKIERKSDIPNQSPSGRAKREYNEKESYHINLKQALIAYLEQSMRSSTSIEEAIKLMNEAEQRIENAVFKELT